MTNDIKKITNRALFWHEATLGVIAAKRGTQEERRSASRILSDAEELLFKATSDHLRKVES